MGCGSSAQKNSVAEPQPASATNNQNAAATKPAAPAPAAAAPPPVQSPAKDITPGKPDVSAAPAPAPAPKAEPPMGAPTGNNAPPAKPELDIGAPTSGPMIENEALAGKLYSPKAGGNNDEDPLKDLMRTPTDNTVPDMLISNDPPGESPLMENAALDGRLFSPKVGQRKEINLMDDSAEPSAADKKLLVGPDSDEVSPLLDNAALKGDLFSPRASKADGVVDLMGGDNSDLTSQAKRDLAGVDDNYQAPLVENLALDGALYSPKSGSPPPEGAGQESKNENLKKAHEEGSTVVGNAALRGDLYSPRGGGEDLMGGGELDAAAKQGLIPEQEGEGSALMENAALQGALFSPRGGSAAEQAPIDLMGGAGQASEEDKKNLVDDAPERAHPLLENVALQGGLFSPRASSAAEQPVDLMGGGGELDEAGKEKLMGEEAAEGSALMENAALQGALFSPRGGSAAAQDEEAGPGTGHGESPLAVNAALQGALFSPRAGSAADDAGGAEGGAGQGEEGDGGHAAMENAALQGALFSPRGGSAA